MKKVDRPFYFDEIRRVAMVDLACIGREGAHEITKPIAIWIKEYLQEKSYKEYGEAMSIGNDFQDCLISYAYKHHKNPFLDIIKNEEWDGLRRVQTFLYNIGCAPFSESSPSPDSVVLEYLSLRIFDIIIKKAQGDHIAGIVPVLVSTTSSKRSRDIVDAIGLGENQYGGFASHNPDPYTSVKEFTRNTIDGAIVSVPSEQLRARSVVDHIANRTHVPYTNLYESNATSRKVTYLMVGIIEGRDLTPMIFTPRIVVPIILDDPRTLSLEDMKADDYYYMRQIYAEMLAKGDEYLSSEAMRLVVDKDLIHLNACRSVDGYDSSCAKLKDWIARKYTDGSHTVFYDDLEKGIAEILNLAPDDAKEFRRSKVHKMLDYFDLDYDAHYTSSKHGRYYRYEGWRRRYDYEYEHGKEAIQ